MYRMNVPCIMLNPIRNRKLIGTNMDTVGNFMTLTMLVIIPPIPLNSEPSEGVRDSGGRVSGSLVTARTSETNERALENKHGSK